MMKLYVYDHCPYCVKARMIFGLRKIPFRMIPLLNDDEETPLSMIGQKMTPILEYASGRFMPESMDIVRYIDDRRRTLSPAQFRSARAVSWKENAQLSTWLDTAQDFLYPLAMPRWVQAPLEEFKTKKAQKYFQKKKEKMLNCSFSSLLTETKQLKQGMEHHLKDLDSLLTTKRYNFFEKEGLSVNDFHLFACLRSLSIVKDLKWSSRVDHYVNNISTKSGVPLHHHLAL